MIQLQGGWHHGATHPAADDQQVTPSYLQDDKRARRGDLHAFNVAEMVVLAHFC